jgi:hypothetical protein
MTKTNSLASKQKIGELPRSGSYKEFKTLWEGRTSRKRPGKIYNYKYENGKLRKTGNPQKQKKKKLTCL